MRKNLFFLSSFIGFFLSSFTHSSIDNLHSFISFIYLFRSCFSSSTSTTLSSWANSYIFLIRFVPIRQERKVCKLDQLTMPLKLAIPSILYYIPHRPQHQHKAAAICNKFYAFGTMLHQSQCATNFKDIKTNRHPTNRRRPSTYE